MFCNKNLLDALCVSSRVLIRMTKCLLSMKSCGNRCCRPLEKINRTPAHHTQAKKKPIQFDWLRDWLEFVQLAIGGVDQFVRVFHIDSITVYTSLSRSLALSLNPCCAVSASDVYYYTIDTYNIHVPVYTVCRNCKNRSLMPINNYNIWDNICFECHGM